jgi:hypothetical protein
MSNAPRNPMYAIKILRRSFDSVEYNCSFGIDSIAFVENITQGTVKNKPDILFLIILGTSEK